MLGPLAAYAWWATGLETFSTASTVAVVGGGAVAVVGGTWLRRRAPHREDARPEGDRSRQRKPGFVVWLVLLAGLAVLQVAMFVREEREDNPTISSIVNDALDTHGARTVACTAWLVGAFRLARRP